MHRKIFKLRYCNFNTPKNYLNKISLVTGSQSQHNISTTKIGLLSVPKSERISKVKDYACRQRKCFTQQSWLVWGR